MACLLDGASETHNSLNTFVLKRVHVFTALQAHRNGTIFRDGVTVFFRPLIPPSDLGFVFIPGLDAAGSFFSRHGASLKELDFSIMSFLWNEKYGHKLKSIEGKKLEHFCEPAAVEDARFLVWLLEEHRDKFPALHAALDEFFDIMGKWAGLGLNRTLWGVGGNLWST